MVYYFVGPDRALEARMNGKDESQDHRPSPRLRALALAGVVCIVVAFDAATTLSQAGYLPDFRDLLQAHFAAIVGLPSAAVASFFLVATLRQASGPIEIDTPGFKLRGASGPIWLWIVCFWQSHLQSKLFGEQ